MKSSDAQAVSSPVRFLLPSCIGILIFLLPVRTDNGLTIVFGILTDNLKVTFERGWDEALLLVVALSAVGSLLVALKILRPEKNSIAEITFAVSPAGVLLRWLGLLVVVCVYFGVGPSLLRLPDTGQTVVYDIGINVLIIYLVGLGFMPLLTSYGLMEFVGSLCRPAFKALFRLPGRAAIDALTSVVAATAIGLLVTLSQYQKGVYSTREASIIACSFSIVSIPFSLLIAKVAGIEALFYPWYLAVLMTCFICALILARIPPLSRLPDTHLSSPAGRGLPAHRETDATGSAVRRAWSDALAALDRAPTFTEYVHGWIRDFLRFSFGVIGPSIALATLASVLMFHSPVMDLIASPIRWLLFVLGVSEAASVAPALIVGFADQFLPALAAGNLTDVYWKFVLAGLSVTQLVFMSEFGLLVLRSELPLGLWHLGCIFVLRTLISLPLLMILANFIVN